VVILGLGHALSTREAERLRIVFATKPAAEEPEVEPAERGRSSSAGELNRRASPRRPLARSRPRAGRGAALAVPSLRPSRLRLHPHRSGRGDENALVAVVPVHAAAERLLLQDLLDYTLPRRLRTALGLDHDAIFRLRKAAWYLPKNRSRGSSWLTALEYAYEQKTPSGPGFVCPEA
jgi:hypothetical protein